MTTSITEVIGSPPDVAVVAGVDTHADTHHVAPHAAYDQRVIHLEAPTHLIPIDASGHRHQPGPTLQASAPTDAESVAAIDAQVPDGYRFTWLHATNTCDGE